MDPDFWHRRWESNQIGFHEGQVNAYLARYYAELGLKPGQTVFVPLCGKSMDLRWLSERGVQVLGVELSPIAVESFFVEQGLPPRIRKDGAFTVWENGPIRSGCCAATSSRSLPGTSPASRPCTTAPPSLPCRRRGVPST